jgi:hypothetical protein
MGRWQLGHGLVVNAIIRLYPQGPTHQHQGKQNKKKAHSKTNLVFFSSLVVSI